jgi:hypothetical protein
MTLAYKKEFEEAEYKVDATTIILVWRRDLSDGSVVIINSISRNGLSDSRPQEDHEPCEFYRWHDHEITDEGRADNPLAAIEAAAKILPPIEALIAACEQEFIGDLCLDDPDDEPVANGLGTDDELVPSRITLA